MELSNKKVCLELCYHYADAQCMWFIIRRRSLYSTCCFTRPTKFESGTLPIEENAATSLEQKSAFEQNKSLLLDFIRMSEQFEFSSSYTYAHS